MYSKWDTIMLLLQRGGNPKLVEVVVSVVGSICIVVVMLIRLTPHKI
jgi:hypothetical protein